MGSPLVSFRRALASRAVAALGLLPEDAATLEGQLRVPEAGRGDIALPCFDLARRASLKPPEVARKLAEALAGDPEWASVDAVGPYINVRIKVAPLAHAVVQAARSPSFTHGDSGEGKTVVIDFSSPNIAKPLAFHHIRSTVIGAAVGRLHAALGWRVVGINYLGDWGKQFGLLGGIAKPTTSGDKMKSIRAKAHSFALFVALLSSMIGHGIAHSQPQTDFIMAVFASEMYLPDYVAKDKGFGAKHGLIADWINNGPKSLMVHFSAGWRGRLTEVFRGKRLSVFVIGRPELIYQRSSPRLTDKKISTTSSGTWRRHIWTGWRAPGRSPT